MKEIEKGTETESSSVSGSMGTVEERAGASLIPATDRAAVSNSMLNGVVPPLGIVETFSPGTPEV